MGGVREVCLSRVQQLRRWTRGGERAPHKPLLLLLMLGRVQRGQLGPVAFTEIERPLADLLRDFGPARPSYHPKFPFHHLTSNGLWSSPTLPARTPARWAPRSAGCAPPAPSAVWRR